MGESLSSSSVGREVITNKNTSINTIPHDKQYPKLPKSTSGYVEVEHFKNADLHTDTFAITVLFY